MIKVPLTILFALICTGLQATEYTWNPTTKDSSGKYYLWNEKANWLVGGATATSYPNATDAIVLVPGNKSQLYSATGKCKEFRYLATDSFPQINQGNLKLVSGGRFSADNAALSSDQSVTWYAGLVCGDTGETGEVEVCIPTRLSLKLQKNISGTCALVKTGAGKLVQGYEVTDSSKTTKRTFTAPKVVYKEGALSLWANVAYENFELVFDGTSDSLRVEYGASVSNERNFVINNGAIRETELAEGTAHGFVTYNSNLRELVFTGTPTLNPMRFTGRFYGRSGLCWNPNTAETPYEFHCVGGVSDTTGQLLVSNGVMRLMKGASFTALSQTTVASGGTLRVDAASGLGFKTGRLDVDASGATLDLGRGVVLMATTAVVGGETLADGVYTSANASWITGAGVVEVGEQPERPTNVLELVEGSSYTVAADSAYAGVTLAADRGDFALEATVDAVLTVGSQGFVATGCDAARTVTLNGPIFLEGPQTWMFSANDTVVLNGPVFTTRRAGIWQIAGAKEIRFRGANVFAHELAISNAVARFYGTTVAGSEGGRITSAPASGARMHFYGVTTAKDILWNGTGPGTVNSMVKLHASEDGLVKTNLFTGLVSVNFGGNQYFETDGGVTTVFRGGVFKSGGLWGPNGTGTMVVEEKSMTPARFSMPWSSTFVLNVAGNKFGANAGQIYSGAQLITKVPYAIQAYDTVNSSAITARLTLSGRLNLSGNDQSVANINGGGVVTSETAAVFHVVDNNMAGSSDGGTTSQVVRVSFDGGASFSKEGKFTNWFYKVSQSTGTVAVAKGRLVFTSKTGSALQLSSKATYARPNVDCAWPNLSAAIVRGGTLALEHAKPWSSKTDVRFELTSGKTGQVELPAEKIVRCRNLIVDDEALPIGIYGGPDSTAANQPTVGGNSLFTGTGLLKVVGPNPGMFVIVR